VIVERHGELGQVDRPSSIELTFEKLCNTP
jgi:hypothetical protein